MPTDAFTLAAMKAAAKRQAQEQPASVASGGDTGRAIDEKKVRLEWLGACFRPLNAQGGRAYGPVHVHGEVDLSHNRLAESAEGAGGRSLFI